LLVRHNSFSCSLASNPIPIALAALLGVSNPIGATSTALMPWRLHLVGQTCKVLWNDLNRFLIHHGRCRASRVRCTNEPSNQFQRIHKWKNELQALRLENFNSPSIIATTKCANEFLTDQGD